MKFLSLQTLIHGYMCLGNNPLSSSSSSLWVQPELNGTKGRRRAKKQRDAAAAAAEAVVKVIQSDGVVNIYRRAIRASELMLEFPKHLVCHSHSFYIGQKIQPLSPQEKLKLGHNYFLLPVHFFQSVLSFVTMASSFAAFNKSQSTSTSPLPNISNNKAVVMGGSCQAFVIKKAPSGSLQIRVSDEFVSKLMQQGKIVRMNSRRDKEEEEEEEEVVDKGVICTTPHLQKDYAQLVTSRSWKPKLETIKESKKRMRICPSSFGIKRRRKKVQAVQQQQQQHATNKNKILKPKKQTRVQKMSAKIKIIRAKANKKKKRLCKN